METIKEKYFRLREEFRTAKGAKRKDEIFRELTALMAEHPEEAGEAYAEGVHDLVERTKALITREELAAVLPALSGAYIAKTYFGKSGSWFSQRLNGHTVNGSTARFTEAELTTLEEAVHDIGRKLLAVSLTKSHPV